jgi:hypothetical protein
MFLFFALLQMVFIKAKEDQFFQSYAAQNREYKHYTLISEPIDVVIPCSEKDFSTLDLCIEGVRAHGKDIRRIIVVSSKRLTDRAEWFDEKLYPFTKESLTQQIFALTKVPSKSYLKRFKGRVGWIYQQFLKFYAPFVIPNISSNVLILDADTIFLHAVAFMNEKRGALFDVGDEFHAPYFVHAKKLIPSFQRMCQESGICHHMLFQKAILDDLFFLVESHHHLPFWIAACRSLDHQQLLNSSLSEYEIYFHFALLATDQVEIRPLKHKNAKSLQEIEAAKQEGLDCVSCHTWQRQ